MKNRVLFTGNGRLIIEDLMAHIPTTCQMYKCAPVESKFMDTLDEFRPHVIVVGLGRETRESLHMYTAMEMNEHYGQTPVIAIGNEEDCDEFYKNIFLPNMKVFVRPLKMDSFKQTLEAFIALSQTYEEERKAKEEPEKKDETEEESFADDKNIDPSLLKKMEILNRDSRRKSVLVVDDDVRMLNVIKLYLQDLYDVTLVPSGKLALKFLSKKPADLVLLDYMMPEEDGPAVLKKIREESPVPNIPVIFLTGVSEKEKVMRGLELRPDAYILKPVSRELLLEKVTEVILELE